ARDRLRSSRKIVAFHRFLRALRTRSRAERAPTAMSFIANKINKLFFDERALAGMPDHRDRLR
ncbi:hypothetical protein, partial [Pseudomonas sp. Leaf127]|uniref:hypothetical protein n=1 Tax=Pseudomonas sp. Leaf127 TaxID=1736267 RepID=UPI001F15E725